MENLESIELKCWCRIRIETNENPKHGLWCGAVDPDPYVLGLPPDPSLFVWFWSFHQAKQLKEP